MQKYSNIFHVRNRIVPLRPSRTCISANVIDLLRGSLIVTQLFRSHGTFSVAESGQAWRPSVLYAQNIGVARLGSTEGQRNWPKPKHLAFSFIFDCKMIYCIIQLFRSYRTFSVAESGQAWRPSVLYAQNIGVARLGSGTRSLRSGWSLAKSVGEYFLRQ